MSDHAAPALPAQAHALPWRAAMPWLIATGLYLLLLTLAGKMLADADIYWHVRVGEWIAAHRAFPHTDFFSATFAGEPWIAKEWLAQLGFAAAYRFAAWPAVAALAAIGVAAAFAILARVLLEKLDPISTLVLVLVAIVLTAPHILARPHALALPVMVLWAVGLVRALDERRAPSWWLLPLMTLWANLHGGFTFGILLAGACALEALLVAPKAARWDVARQWGLFGVLAVLAACVTPYGPTSILMTGRILGLGEALGLKWEDLDLNEQTLRVRRSRWRPKYKHGCETPCGRKSAGHCAPTVSTPGPIPKTRSPRLVSETSVCPRRSWLKLEAHEQEQEAECQKASDRGFLQGAPSVSGPQTARSPPPRYVGGWPHTGVNEGN